MPRTKSRKLFKFKKSSKSLKRKSKSLRVKKSKSIKRKSSKKRGGGYISYTFDLNDRIKNMPSVVRVKR